MMAFTADGQLDPELLASRDKICNVDSGARGRVRSACFRGQPLYVCTCWGGAATRMNRCMHECECYAVPGHINTALVTVRAFGFTVPCDIELCCTPRRVRPTSATSSCRATRPTSRSTPARAISWICTTAATSGRAQIPVSAWTKPLGFVPFVPLAAARIRLDARKVVAASCWDQAAHQHAVIAAARLADSKTCFPARV